MSHTSIIMLAAQDILSERTSDKTSVSPSDWIKSKTGYSMFTGNDKVLSGYTFKGSPSIKNMGIENWPDKEVNGYEDSMKEKALKDKFKFARPEVLVINPDKKLIALLFAGYENGRDDRTHHSGMSWIYKHYKGNAKEWFPLVNSSDGAFIFPETPKEAIEAALKLGFIKNGDTLSIYTDSGLKKFQVSEFIKDKNGKNHNPALTTQSKRIIASIRKVYKLELQYSEIDSNVGIDGKKKEAIGKQLIEAIRSASTLVRMVVKKDFLTGEINMRNLEEMDSYSRLSDHVKKTAKQVLTPFFKAFDKTLELLDDDGDIGTAIVSFNVAKQRLHRFTKDHPELSEALFGSKEIVHELNAMSSM